MASIPDPGKSHMPRSTWTQAPQPLSLCSRAQEAHTVPLESSTFSLQLDKAHAQQWTLSVGVVSYMVEITKLYIFGKYPSLPSLRAQFVKKLPAMQETLVQFLGWEDQLRRDRLPTPVFLGFPCGSAGKESTHNAGSISDLGRPPGEGKGYLLQYAGLQNPMDCIVHGVTKSQTQLRNFHFPA